MILSEEAFEKLVMEAIDGLPDFFKSKMENVAVLVQAWPSQDELNRAGVAPGHTLLGLYSGIPLTQRTQGYHSVPPDTITLYQGTIEMKAGHDDAALRYWVRHVFLHELAHHFGISDDRLRELGAY
ncbi:MAG: metallopeptidase family protein [Anaerolineae bacterium]|nr:metallopeptidase family protein [Anaerolineae bacterium]